MNKYKNKLKIFLPGIVVAATGVGAGDLATAAFSGNKLGIGIIWAVILGAFFKFFLNESLIRRQLSTKETFFNSLNTHIGKTILIIFIFYLVIWTYMVGAALMSATGIAFNALVPVFDNQVTAKRFFGILFSIVSLFIVFKGGYNLLEKIMSVFTGIMFITVIITAILIIPDSNNSLINFIPIFPSSKEEVEWTIALMGGVGGTVTILSYGFWINEHKRNSIKEIKTCRYDLASAYLITAIFGIAMVILGSNIELSGSGSELIVNLGKKLENQLGLIPKNIFLIGAFGAIFSSMLGVWQGVPYLFTDTFNHISNKSTENKSYDKTLTYKIYAILLSTIPAIGLWSRFDFIQKIYAYSGALFMPFLAGVLLYLNNKSDIKKLKTHNNLINNTIMVLILVFFLFFGILNILN